MNGLSSAGGSSNGHQRRCRHLPDSAAGHYGLGMCLLFAGEFVGDETPIRVRIGINAGEPIEEEDDLHGTAVISSARIMGAADGGQILVSSLVRELVAGRDYRFVSRGFKELKGFAEPVPVFELDWRHHGPASQAEAAAATLRDRISVDPGPGEWFEITPQAIEKFTNATLGQANDGAAPPLLVLSLLTHLIESIPDEAIPSDGLLAGINYGFDAVRFGPPAGEGARLRARSVLTDAMARGTVVQATSHVTVEVEDRQEPALQADWVVRIMYAS